MPRMRGCTLRGCGYMGELQNNPPFFNYNKDDTKKEKAECLWIDTFSCDGCSRLTSGKPCWKYPLKRKDDR